uniref:PadR family transcriptional regulator n=1 Tax=Thaumasiovibrio occultus TaxID=1891184 RepID=UPI000B3579EB|nr:PadR family transcriptional regulator [Thaumasiovibrio occultus]
MSLPHVILTVLSSRDATGYDITKEFSHSIGYFWKASHQQVYRELNKMAVNDLVTCVLQPQEGKPDRKVYSITDLGRSSLFEWFEEPVRNPTVRDELSAKLLVCSVHNSVPMQEHIKNLMEETTKLVEHYRELERQHFADPDTLSRQERLDRLTLRRCILNSESWLVWAAEVIAELADMDSEQSATAL